MRNFGTIYKYEIKKLTGRRLFWITALLCVLGICLTTFSGLLGTYYVDGEPIESHFEGFQKDQKYRQELSGKAVDQELLQETVDAYAHVPTDVPRYTLTEEYQTFARPYSPIFNLIRSFTGMDLLTIQNWEVDEAALYEARAKGLESSWQDIPLTETEKAFWRNQESQIAAPLTYYYHQGYESILSSFLTVGLLMLLFVAICLPSLFADEHTRRTDQLVLSSAKGKEAAYWAKIGAGVTVCAVVATAMALITVGLNLAFYGAEGFSMPFQVFLWSYSYPLTIGQACLISYGLLVVASVLAGVFVMVISEVFRSGLVALSISTALIILGQVIMIPTQYRVLAQMWDWSPMAYLSTWQVFDPRTLTLFGRCFVSWQVVPILYVLLSALLAIVGQYVYRRYQVCGR